MIERKWVSPITLLFLTAFFQTVSRLGACLDLATANLCLSRSQVGPKALPSGVAANQLTPITLLRSGVILPTSLHLGVYSVRAGFYFHLVMPRSRQSNARAHASKCRAPQSKCFQCRPTPLLLKRRCTGDASRAASTDCESYVTANEKAHRPPPAAHVRWNRCVRKSPRAENKTRAAVRVERPC